MPFIVKDNKTALYVVACIWNVLITLFFNLCISNSQTFLSQDRFMHLKIMEDSQIAFVYVGYILSVFTVLDLSICTLLEI